MMDRSRCHRHIAIAVAVWAALWTTACVDKVSTAPALAGDLDTLRNHAANAALNLPVYESPQRGFILGVNSYLRQQYAEKYFIEGSGRIAGVVAHVGGKYANPNNTVDFAVRAVGLDGLPGERLGGAAVRYVDLDLTGDAQFVTFATPVSVTDSFFVTFDLGDYGHGGFEGDTLGLYACTPGCRDSADLLVYGRNAVQRHNHNRVDWRDFHYQNLTPILTHFALYPVGENLKP